MPKTIATIPARFALIAHLLRTVLRFAVAEHFRAAVLAVAQAGLRVSATPRSVHRRNDRVNDSFRPWLDSTGTQRTARSADDGPRYRHPGIRKIQAKGPSPDTPHEMACEVGVGCVDADDG